MARVVGTGHPFFDFSPEVRKVVYTTSMIESINSEPRRSVRNRDFPSDEALIKVLDLRCKDMGRTRRGRAHVGKTGYVWKTAPPVRGHGMQVVDWHSDDGIRPVACRCPPQRG